MDVVRELELSEHPEGGWFRETWRDGAGTSIYFLLSGDAPSGWHRVRDRAEIWSFHAGAPLRLDVAGRPPQVLGVDLGAGQLPQGVVAPGAWQRAESLGAWTLAGCAVFPAFTYEAFELAPPGWEPLS
jgi:predicted cupin superfamily sugar epimerase